MSVMFSETQCMNISLFSSHKQCSSDLNVLQFLRSSVQLTKLRNPLGSNYQLYIRYYDT